MQFNKIHNCGYYSLIMQGPHKYKSNIIVAILAENMQAELPNNDYVMFIDELMSEC